MILKLPICLSLTSCCLSCNFTMWTNKNNCLNAFDADRDGKLNFEEFSALCKCLFQNEKGVAYPLDEQNAKVIFEIFDRNSDEFIDKDEFNSVWNQWINVILKPVAALLVVDVQNDFISGTLQIKNCKDLPKNGDVVSPINRLLDTIPFSVVAYSLDWHADNHVSFIDNVKLRRLHETSQVTSDIAKVFDTVIFEGPPVMEQKLWPKHAVQNTWGSELHKDLKILDGAIKVYKGTNSEVDSYSAFWDNMKMNETPLRMELKNRNITDLFVCGLAYDYCVGNTCLDAIKAGFRTTIIDDCTMGISFESVDKMKAAIISKYGVVVESDKVLAMVDGRDRRPELGYKLATELRTGLF